MNGPRDRLELEEDGDSMNRMMALQIVSMCQQDDRVFSAARNSFDGPHVWQSRRMLKKTSS
jgi:hypothetical protein